MEDLTLGEALSAARKDAALGQAQVAAMACVSVGTVSRAERGHLVPSARNLAAIAHAVRMPAATLTDYGHTGAAFLLRAMLAGDNAPATPDTAAYAVVHEAMRKLLPLGWRVEISQENTRTETALALIARKPRDS